MKKNILVFTVLFSIPNATFASEAGNILACINAVKTYTGKTVDEFDANYTGKIFSFSTAEWSGIKCEVAFDSVQNLTVDGEKYMVDGFSGIDAKRTYEQISEKTDKAVSLLNSRVKLLEQRLERSANQLRQPNPNLNEIKDFIATGVSKAVGN
ncbi:hypothetical protein N9K33_05165 [Planktomarina temperata]|nr:hypothetical protein [Planktomarina temperata]